ncbi:MAG: GNAT family N-acetyltransferase [Lachnospiraceae bacterium]|nr:GNAT family N-acetyltransferase [Lachnospiraceae bacterium]
MREIRLPKPTGEYAVGTFTYTVRDVRKEVMQQGGMRSVAARVYYPVLKESVKDLPKAVALSDNMLKGFRDAFKVAPNFKKNPEANRSECYAGAERIAGAKFPLILFNHGYNSYRESNSFLCIDLASHGYVVICVNHSHEALCTEFDDGTVLFFDQTLAKRMYEPKLGGLIAMLKLTKEKGSDEELAEKFDAAQRKYCRFLMDRLPEWVKDNEAALAYAKKNLSDLIDFEKGVGVSGHSMGGNAAYALCARNDDFVCGINIDGGLFGDYTGDDLKKPFMQISCKDNENVVNRVYLKHTKPIYKAFFKDMKHIGFSDAKHFIPVKAVVGKLDADVMHENLCRCHLDFFDAYLKKNKDAPALKSNEYVRISVYESIELRPVKREDVETVWRMQVEAFSDLLKKYEDYDTSPAAEGMDKVLARFEQPWTTYYFILVNDEKAGVIRVADKKDGSRKRISPIWIMPEYRNKGYATQAILAVEEKYGSDNWCLDTILQEKGNLHLYEKLGYHQTGRIEKINDRMDIVFYEKG